jgi:hypothetical protein
LGLKLTQSQWTEQNKQAALRVLHFGQCAGGTNTAEEMEDEDYGGARDRPAINIE